MPELSPKSLYDMKYKTLHSIMEKVSAIGQGTGVGGFLAKGAVYEDRHREAIKSGIDLGMTFIDSAEEYGMGEAERVVGQAVSNVRDTVFLATKVSPENLKYHDVLRAAERSLERLHADYIDLYQIHWPNPQIPMGETMEAMDKLIEEGKIRYVGLCNSSLQELKEARASLSADKLVSVQSEYNLFDRSIEKATLPYCDEKGILTIAYSPLGQGKIARGARKVDFLNKIAEKYCKTPGQIVLNWLIHHKNVMAIPQSTDLNHIRENAESPDFDLSKEDLDQIDELFAIKLVHLPPEKIRPYPLGSDMSRTYTTVAEARENRFKIVPSPEALARNLQYGVILKPVKVRKVSGKSQEYEYELTEGRLRYWAWVIAFNQEKPVPVLVQE